MLKREVEKPKCTLSSQQFTRLEIESFARQRLIGDPHPWQVLGAQHGSLSQNYGRLDPGSLGSTTAHQGKDNNLLDKSRLAGAPPASRGVPRFRVTLETRQRYHEGGCPRKRHWKRRLHHNQVGNCRRRKERFVFIDAHARSNAPQQQ